MLWPARMKTRSRSSLVLLFPHLEDPAYPKVCALEELVSTFIASRSTSPFKERLQRAIARIADAVVEYSDADGDANRDLALSTALRACHKAAIAVEMLYRAGVCTPTCRAKAFEWLGDIAQLLIERICALLDLPTPGLLPRPMFEEVGRDEVPPKSQAPPAAA
jgi:hypothetical protein